MFLYRMYLFLSSFLHFFLIILVFHKYISHIIIPLMYKLNLHFVFLLLFFSCPSLIFYKTGIFFSLFFASALHPSFHFSVSIIVRDAKRRSRKTDVY